MMNNFMISIIHEEKLSEDSRRRVSSTNARP